MLERLRMIRFLICEKYIFVFFLLLISFNAFAAGKERNCLNYPYPEGIYLKSKSSNRKQLIFTKTIVIKSQNIRKIEFIKRKNNLYAITSLNKYIKLYFPNIQREEIGIFNLFSCFDSDGTYKISYAQRDVSLKTLNIFQKVKNFIDNKFFNDG
tara:strand:- start:2382 stop:2843 length:462 start_codon:yes stop_codon:yes gene_type:complete